MDFLAVVIEPSNAPRIERITSSTQLRKLIGGYLEMISFGEAACYLNEDGKMLDLPPNALATEFCNTIGSPLWPGDFIAGTMVIFGRFDENGRDDGEEHDVPQDVIEKINHLLGISL